MNRTRQYSDKIVTADEAVLKTLIKGTNVVFGHAAAAPTSFSKAMFDQRSQLSDITVFHMLYFGEPYHLRPEMEGHVRGRLNFLEGNSRPAYNDHRAEFIPCHFSEVPNLFREGFYRVDVAAVQVSEPDENGYCSFGISCDYTKPATEAAKIVVAEINKQMPYIGGDNLIHLDNIDYIIPVDKPIVEVPPAAIGETELTIGRHCAKLIRNGDTLQLGIGGIPDAVLTALEGHENLGIHTEMFTNGVMRAMQSGLINGKCKTLHPGKVVTSLIMGTRELYEFLDHNPNVLGYPVDYTNDPYIIAQNDRLISINSCLEIDLMGQVASESIGYRQFSGTGGQVDFFRGARKSKGGIAIMAFPSTAKNGTQSRIVSLLNEGSCVTTGRNEVDYAVTEFGAVRLRGATLRERAALLVSIAHPNFRPELDAEVARRFGK